MADGVEHLSSLMELMPQVKLSILDGDRSCAWWSGDCSFYVHEAIAIGHDMRLCLSTDDRDLSIFTIHCRHVMGAMSGDTIRIDDEMAGMIAMFVHRMIESGALLSDA